MILFLLMGLCLPWRLAIPHAGGGPRIRVLTCNLHGWDWDLKTGKCLTSKGHPLRCTKL